MKKFLLTTSLILMGVLVFAQTETHDGRITGVISLGNKEVSAVHDLKTDCIYKSEPHTKGLFIPGEDVKLNIDMRNLERGEIIKPNLPEVVYIHDRGCGDDNNFNPDVKSNIIYSDINTLEKGFVGKKGSTKILAYKDMNTFIFTLRELERQVNEMDNLFLQYYSRLNEEDLNEKAQQIRFDEEKPLFIFNKRLKFNSLFEKMNKELEYFLSNEDQNSNWENFPSHFLSDVELQAMFNTDAEVKIGTSIYKFNDDGSYYEIIDGDLLTLQGIDNGSVDVDTKTNIIIHNPEPPTPDGWCKANKSRNGGISAGTNRIRWEVGAYLYPWVACYLRAKTTAYKYQLSSGKYKWVEYKTSITSSVGGNLTCDGNAGWRTKNDTSKTVSVSSEFGYCQSLSGEVVGYHSALGINYHSYLTF